MATIRDLKVRLGLDSSSFVAGMKGADASIAATTAKTTALGNTTAVSMNKATAATNGFATASRALGAIFITGAIAQGVTKILRKASDVQETMNVLNVVFGQSSAEIKDWSKTTAREMGRSQFRIREMVGSFGALLSPTVQNTVEVEKMSKALTKTGIDLASLFNTADDDALNALKSGITGQVKPLRRYGIDLTVANLAQFAFEKGIRKTFSTMTSGEKQMLRFNFIMERSKQAAGDAARTTQFYANSTKALKDFITETATIMALEAIPVLEKLFAFFRQAAMGVQSLNDKFGIFKPIVLGITAALSFFGSKMLIKFAPFITRIGLLGAAFTALGFIIEDVIVFFQGGESAIGGFLDKLGGAGTAKKTLEEIQLIVRALGDDFEVLGVRIESIFNKIGDAIDRAFDKLSIPEPVKNFFNKIGGAFGSLFTVPEESFPGEKQSTRNIVREQNFTPVAGQSLPSFIAPGSSAPSNNNANINVTVNAQTNASPEDIARVVREGMSNMVTEAFDGTVKFAE